jgi:hypothetical protein
MSPLLLYFNKYNLGFNHKILAPLSPRDETLTLVFKMPSKLQETLALPRQER